MKEPATLIFDIGKTNKKYFLFDRQLQQVLSGETNLEETADEDGFPCENAAALESWIDRTVGSILRQGRYRLEKLNFTTYGATLVYLDKKGKRATPVYNYLKPMSDGVLDGFYETYGGELEFCRKTASPPLGMLNSGLQLLWMKRKKPVTFHRIQHILHLPQYLSFRLSGKITSEPTSIGCHTALWDFDQMHYHKWTQLEKIELPGPGDVNQTYPVRGLERVTTGVGLHDSSASLVPYMVACRESFVLVSTGTWCISMNPFNQDPLTAEELEQDCLCYLGVHGKPVKSSRFFLGHIHDLNVQRIEAHFGAEGGTCRQFSWQESTDGKSNDTGKPDPVFFSRGIPEGYVDMSVQPDRFRNLREAYLQLMKDLTSKVARSVELVLGEKDPAGYIYIAGGFAKNSFFTHLLARHFSGKKVYTSRIHNATAMGALLVTAGHARNREQVFPDLGLTRVEPQQ